MKNLFVFRFVHIEICFDGQRQFLKIFFWKFSFFLRPINLHFDRGQASPSSSCRTLSLIDIHRTSRADSYRRSSFHRTRKRKKGKGKKTLKKRKKTHNGGGSSERASEREKETRETSIELKHLIDRRKGKKIFSDLQQKYKKTSRFFFVFSFSFEHFVYDRSSMFISIIDADWCFKRFEWNRLFNVSSNDFNLFRFKISSLNKKKS